MIKGGRLLQARVLLVLASSIAASHPQAQAQSRALPEEELRIFVGAYQALQDSLAPRQDGRALLVHAIKGMVKGADPDGGEYFTPEEFQDFRAPRPPNSAAVGLQVRQKNGQFLLQPVPGGPATEAGVRFGDVLHAVDGERVKAIGGLSKIVDKLSGSEGTKVALTVFRESSLTVHTIPVERKNFQAERPVVNRPAPHIALLRIPSFHADTLYETAWALRDAWKAEPFKGVVLDLRGCPGGLLEIAVGVASIFLTREETVVHMNGPAADAKFVYKASPPFYQRRSGPDPVAEVPDLVRKLPVVVLVDGATASGAEVVAAALQDHKRATVMGQTTQGVASIFRVSPLGSGGIKYTMAHWFSPNGRTLHGKGISPDIVVNDPWAAETVLTAAESLVK